MPSPQLLPTVSQNLPRNHQPIDLPGAFVNIGDLRVPDHAAGGDVQQVDARGLHVTNLDITHRLALPRRPKQP